MSHTIKLEDGTEAEVFTADEIEAQKLEAIEQYKLDNPDKEDEITNLQEQLKEKEEELAKAGDKDRNFAGLRKAKEDAEKKLEDFTKTIDTKINTIKQEVIEGVMKDHYNDTIEALSGGDEETQKKIEYHYKRLADPVSTKQEITNKLRDAYILATKPEGMDALNSTVLSSGGVGKLNIKPQDKKFSAEEKVLAAKFGIDSKDIEKYGK